MKSSMALAAGLTAVLVAVFTLPTQAAFAATIEAEITPGALNKSTDAYAPNPIEANVGDTVVWTNNDTTIHTVTSGTATDGPDGQFGGTAEQPTLVFANAKFEHTFTAEGEFPYYCTLHPAMVGTVIVSAGGGGNGNGEPTESSAETVHEGQTYTVTAMSADTSVTEVHIIPSQSVQVEFEGPGEVELTLPKSMISGSLMVDGAAAEVVNEDDQSTTISFTVPERRTVEITGATVIPEFGVIAALVLAVSLVAVIGVARFKGNLFGLGRF
ncbi:MAG TPA: plastocyanin/azurin family copper-binding protein [Nitrososphaera sp.]